MCFISMLFFNFIWTCIHCFVNSFCINRAEFAINFSVFFYIYLNLYILISLHLIYFVCDSADVIAIHYACN